MKKFYWIVTLLFFNTDAPSYAQDMTNKLERIGIELLSSPNVNHTEYRGCLTTIGYNCAPWNDDYEQIEVHGPSIAETLSWIGDQLTKRQLVQLYQFEGCKIVVDMTEGAPASLMWLEKGGHKTFQANRSIFTPPRGSVFRAEWFNYNGHYSYVKKNHRDNGSSASPKRLIYYNDAALIDLTKIRETKSHVVTDEEGNLVLRDKPASAFRFNFFKTGDDHVVGTQFDDQASVFTKGPSLFPNAEKILNIFDDQYVPFQSEEHTPQFKIMLTPNDVEFALNIAKAFRHAIELCELKSN